ncbi:hypothetical protein CHS0354_018484 [Potamilus streckersoni]|uniref:Uncharacterized protein n=1 Tax=Potamilus streckersoni TaxID=2493646 RepID=A0AAE0TAN2_9BIVA|nr:hypothetical protein CHS0354_018484 [Potamilus streckersoni]
MAGGLVQSSFQSTIKGFSTGNISGSALAGGIVASASASTVYGFSTGSVSGSSGGGAIGHIIRQSVQAPDGVSYSNQYRVSRSVVFSSSPVTYNNKTKMPTVRAVNDQRSLGTPYWRGSSAMTVSEFESTWESATSAVGNYVEVSGYSRGAITFASPAANDKIGGLLAKADNVRIRGYSLSSLPSSNAKCGVNSYNANSYLFTDSGHNWAYYKSNPKVYCFQSTTGTGDAGNIDLTGTKAQASFDTSYFTFGTNAWEWSWDAVRGRPVINVPTTEFPFNTTEGVAALAVAR